MAKYMAVFHLDLQNHASVPGTEKRNESRLAGTSKDLPMGVRKLSFSSFHSRFSERAEFPFRVQICKKAEQVGGCLGKSVGKCQAEAAGS